MEIFLIILSCTICIGIPLYFMCDHLARATAKEKPTFLDMILCLIWAFLVASNIAVSIVHVAKYYAKNPISITQEESSND